MRGLVNGAPTELEAFFAPDRSLWQRALRRLRARLPGLLVIANLGHLLAANRIDGLCSRRGWRSHWSGRRGRPGGIVRLYIRLQRCIRHAFLQRPLGVLLDALLLGFVLIGCQIPLC